jgi:excisionase family DNA binding protein
MFDNIADYMTVQEFARKFDYHPEHVRRLIRNGELEAVKLKRWRISPEAVERFVESRSVVKKWPKEQG